MTESKSILLSIYGARLSKDAKKIILTLVGGENNEKQFYTACVKLDNSQKTTVELDTKDEKAIFKIPLLKDNKEVVKEDKEKQIEDDQELPF